MLDALDWVDKNKAIYNIRILNFSVGFLPGAQDEDQREIVEKLIDYILVGKKDPVTKEVPIEIHWNF